jgi:hypothetical protein
VQKSLGTEHLLLYPVCERSCGTTPTSKTCPTFFVYKTSKALMHEYMGALSVQMARDPRGEELPASGSHRFMR